MIQLFNQYWYLISFNFFLKVVFFLGLGNPFYEAHGAVLFDVATNSPDVVSINNSSNTHGGGGNIHLKVCFT